MNMGSIHDKFVAKGWDTMATFAFATGFSTSGPDDQKFLNDIAIPLLGADHVWTAALRRLHYTCFVHTTHDMAAQTSKTEEDVDKPSKLPSQERGARLQALQKELPGMEIRGPLEPSCKLVDRLIGMQVSGHLRVLSWEDLTRRDQEILNVKTEEWWKTDAQHRLVKVETQVEAAADTGSDLRLYQALTRRGVALHLAQLLSFPVHDKLVKKFLRELERDPIDGFKRIGVSQIHRADRELWTLVAEMTDGNLNINTDGTFTLDQHLPVAMAHERFTFLLLPMAGSDNERKKDVRSEIVFQASQRRHPAQGNSSGSGKSQGVHKKDKKKKGKGKGDSKGKGTVAKGAPKKLQGLSLVGKERICYAFNLEGCNKTNCPRGAHKCLKCGGPHSQRTCNR